MFDTFLAACKDPKAPVQFPVRKLAPKVGNVKKVLLLGSGGTSIGQAGEFDYSGGQAIKVGGYFQYAAATAALRQYLHQFTFSTFLQTSGRHSKKKERKSYS